MTGIGESPDLTSVCIICYKSFISELNCDARKSVGTSLKMLFRQLELDTEVCLDAIEACTDCSLVLESYGEIHHQRMLLESQLEWRIQEISSLIRSAGRIPKRVQAFKAWCAHQDNNNHVGVGSRLKQLRSNLRSESMKYQTKSVPRVQLDRIDKDNTFQNAGNKGHFNQKALFCGWISSCIAVAALADFRNDNTEDLKQFEDIPIDELQEIRRPVETNKNPFHANLLHKNIARIHCGICKALFSSGSSLRRHKKRLHPDHTVMRRVSSNHKKSTRPLFKTCAESCLQGIRNNSFASTRFQCNMCKNSYAWKKDLFRHKQKHHAEPLTGGTKLKANRKVNKCRIPCQCDKCQCWFRDNVYMRQHAKSCNSHQDDSLDNVSLEVSATPDTKRTNNCDNLKAPTVETNMVRAVQTVIDTLNSGFTGSRGSRRKSGRKTLATAEGVFKSQTVLNDDQVSSSSNMIFIKSCKSAEMEAPRKLNSTLDFICQFCNRKMKERSHLEGHVAYIHRFYHENAREYRHLDIKKGQAARIFFCPFCGLQDTSVEGMKRHFRAIHKDLFGVPKIGIDTLKLDTYLGQQVTKLE